MAFNPYRLSRFAVLVFFTLVILLKNNAHAIDQLDLILCGRKGNQFYVTSTPFIVHGTYLYAELLIKAIDGPWPVKSNGVAYTLDEYKLEVVRKVILTSPMRLRLILSRMNPPEDSPWVEIMGKMSRYPRPLQVINDIRFSVFLCGPDILDSPLLIKLIEKVNRRYGYNFNPFSDKIVSAALKMHGVKDSTIKRKHALSENKSPRAKSPEKERSPAGPSQKPLEKPEEKPAVQQKQSLVLNESEFEEFKHEKSFESDYSKTPPFPEEEQRQESLSKPTHSPRAAANELPVTLFESSTSLPSSPELPEISGVRVSRINRAGKYSADQGPEGSVSSGSLGALKSERLSDSQAKHLAMEDVRLQSDENTTIQSPTDVQIETHPHISSPFFEQGGLEGSGKTVPEQTSNETVTPRVYHESLGTLAPSLESQIDTETLEEDAKNYREQEEYAKNYREQEEVAKRLGEEAQVQVPMQSGDGVEAANEGYVGEEEEEEEEEEEDDDFVSEDEYNQYLDYNDHRFINKEEAENEILGKPRETKKLSANYPLGKRERPQRALLQDVSSVFTDLLNSVKINRISDANIAFGIPSINLRLNTRSKAILFGDRIIRKWKAQRIDGVLKSIPIFHQGSFEELSSPATRPDLPLNSTKREPDFIEVDFSSAIRSHDKNEGGYVWTQRNLIATKKTTGFQDILIKAALEGLQALTSMQCSAILEMPISSEEVTACVSAYFSSIHFGQNKVYGALTEDDEEKSIHGFEVSKAFPSREHPFKKAYKDKSLGQANITLQKDTQERTGSRKQEISDFDVADDLIRKHIQDTSNMVRPQVPMELVSTKNPEDATLDSKDKRGQFRENSEELSDHSSEERSPSAHSAVNVTALDSKTPYETQALDFDELPGAPDSEGSFRIYPKLKEIPTVDNANLEVTPNQLVDPEFIDNALQTLAMNVTESYKLITNELKVPTNNLELTIDSYNSLLETIEVWSAITGEILILMTKKMSRSFVTKATKLSYFYSREEFYVYRAIINYSSLLLESMKSLVVIKRILESTRDLLKKSLTTMITYESVQDLSKKLDESIASFNNSFSFKLQVFCNGMPALDCLNVMKEDFYRRNEKFSGFIARQGALKKTISQILEIFNIKVSIKESISTYEGSRDDINRYLVIKEYISNQVPIFTENVSKSLLKKQLATDVSDAKLAINMVLDKNELVSKRSICGEVRWDPKNRAQNNTEKNE